MNEISCPVCLDLIPLVKDDVASSASRQAVMQHLKQCADCRRAYEESGLEKPMLDDRRVIVQIRSQLVLAAGIMVVLGALVGIGLSDSSLVFYNAIIMPTVGALGYIWLRGKSYLVPLAMLPFAYVWYFLKYLFGGESQLQVLLLSPLFWGLIYTGLCALGTLVAFLLAFAFGKEDKSDANIL